MNAIVPVDATFADFGDPRVSFVVVAGTGDHEAALMVDGRAGTTLVLNDLIFNVGHRQGIGGWMMKTLGMTGDHPHLPALVRMREVKDKRAFTEQLTRWSHIPSLKRIIVSHGDVIERDPAAVLDRVAAELNA